MAGERNITGSYGTVICPNCKTAIPTNEYPKHVDGHRTALVNTSPGAKNTVRDQDVVYTNQPQYLGPSTTSDKGKTGT